MSGFHVYLHPRPRTIATRAIDPGDPIEVERRRILTLNVSPTEIAKGSFPLSFETATENLNAVPRMFIEADGFFVWASEQSDDDWQLSGHLFDRDQRLSHVELHGRCPPAELSKIVKCFELSEDRLAVQLVRQGVFVSYGQFLATMDA